MTDHPDKGGADDTVIKRMNMPFDPDDPVDAKFLALYEACTDGVKLHLCKELLLAALPTTPEEEDVLLARAMRRASGRRRGRPTSKVERVVRPVSAQPSSGPIKDPVSDQGAVPTPAVQHAASSSPPLVAFPDPPPASVPATPEVIPGVPGPDIKNFAKLAGVSGGWAN